MPHYYLNIRDKDQLIEDPDGSEHPDLGAVRAEALEGARAILAEKVRAGALIDHQRFEITDEAWIVLDIIPLRTVLRLA